MDEEVLLKFKPSKASELGLFIWGFILLVVGFAIPVLLVIAVPLLLIAWIKTYSTKYKLTTQRFVKRRGIIARHEEEIELYRVQDVKLNQGFFQRLLGIGDVTIVSADKTTPCLLLKGIRNPEKIKETLRTAYKDARRVEGVRNTEFTN